MPDDLSWAVSAKHRSLHPRIRHVSDCLAVRGRAHGKATSTGMFTCSLFGISARCYRRKGHRGMDGQVLFFYLSLSLFILRYVLEDRQQEGTRNKQLQKCPASASDEPMAVLFTIALAPEITTMISRTNIHKHLHRCCLLAPDTLPSLGDWLCHF